MQKQAFRPSRTLVTILGVVLLGALLVPAGAGAQEGPTLDLSPSSGPAGTEVDVDSCGWDGEGLEVTITWDSGDQLGQATTDSNACVALTVTVPDATTGSHTVTAADQEQGEATAEFTVEEEQTDPEPEPEQPDRLAALETMRADSSAPVDVVWDGAILRGVTGRWDVAGPDEGVVTERFLSRYADAHDLDPTRLFLDHVTATSHFRTVDLGQHLHGIRVYDAQVSVHVRNGTVRDSGGQYLPQSYLDEHTPFLAQEPEPDIPRSAAVAAAESDTGGAAMGEAVPVIFVPGFSGVIENSWTTATPGTREPPRLAWRVAVAGAATDAVPARDVEVVVDAADGAVLHRRALSAADSWDPQWEVTDVAGGTPQGGSCSQRYANLTQTLWFDEDGQQVADSQLDGDGDGEDADEFLRDTFVYHHDEFGRHGWSDDEDDRMPVYVNVSGNNLNSARMTGCMTIEVRDDFVALDLMAHEFTHGVDSNSAQLVYQNQSGALDESFADVFGQLVEAAQDDPVDDTEIDEWDIAEDAPGGPFRNLADPPSEGSPDHMDANQDGSGTGLRSVANGQPSCANDNGCVHTNSGIPNKVAHLLLRPDGDVLTHGGYDVAGIGVERAETLYHHTRLGLPSSATFADAAQHMEVHARVMARFNIQGTTTQHVCAVRNAWAAVGVNQANADVDCDGTADGDDNDSDGDKIPDADDNCPQAANPAQTDTDGDGTGDVCDVDDDGDGVQDTDDNCPLIPNPGQDDRDGDGTGDACDDRDGDGIANHEDNCEQTNNPDQTDTDGDGDGDACDVDDDGDGIQDVDDNCQRTPNSGQTDSDGDGTGDACDTCPSTSNPSQRDTDQDGSGDACDDDIDDDGIPNDDDNCPFVHNPSQVDYDGDGVGSICDQEEERRSIPGGYELDFEAHVDTDGVRLPLEPCAVEVCTPEGFNGDGFRSEVTLGTCEPGVGTRVVRDDGTTVATGSTTAGSGSATDCAQVAPKRVGFDLDPSMRQGLAGEDQLSGGDGLTAQHVDGSATHEGMGYFLHVQPGEDMEPGTHRFTLTVKTERQDLDDTGPSAACPPGEVPPAGFGDVSGDNVHADTIDCVAWWEVAEGRSAEVFAPDRPVTRGQQATFLARALDAAGVALPADPADAFEDDDGTEHEPAIDQLADLGVVKGTSDTTYEPNRHVRRNQMASLLVRAHEHVTGRALPVGRDQFTDDDGTVHEDNINRAATAGFTTGLTDTRYAPGRDVVRKQMASFLSRVLESLVDEDHANPWTLDRSG